jgi:hypothetical protein
VAQLTWVPVEMTDPVDTRHGGPTEPVGRRNVGRGLVLRSGLTVGTGRPSNRQAGERSAGWTSEPGASRGRAHRRTRRPWADGVGGPDRPPHRARTRKRRETIRSPASVVSASSAIAHDGDAVLTAAAERTALGR